MKFLVDAQLPRRLASWLQDQGHDAIHTLILPQGNRTSDSEVTAFADAAGRVVITKDADFAASHVVSGQPTRLLLVSTGNLTNAELEKLFQSSLPEIERALESGDFIELTWDKLIHHS